MPLEVCKAALQGVQGVLPHVTTSRREALLAAVTALSSRAAARTAAKAACIGFQQALLAQGGQVIYPHPVTGIVLLPEGFFIQWVQVSVLLWTDMFTCCDELLSACIPAKAACIGLQQALLAQRGQIIYPHPMTGVVLLPEAMLIQQVHVTERLSTGLFACNDDAHNCCTPVLYRSIKGARQQQASNPMLAPVS